MSWFWHFRAAQFLGQVAEAFALGVAGELVGVDGGPGHAAEGETEQRGDEETLHRASGSSSSCWYSGASCSRQTFWSTTPTILWRMMPCLSIR